ncbi:uncharacterized protein TrAFT101_000255 [Trichoderma asperellum]|uniref:uncharacterized protein n=1 Tax=Trichoderma asperellum TaxID=101201 RepID=UPI0033172C4E|nr:hypothetical protein TrAFT101_000255 [Trichoderma asperellum]
MWDKPWTKEQVRSVPWIDGVGLDGGVDTLAGRWDEEKDAMFASFRTWHGRTVSIRPVFKQLRAGRYGVYINGSFSGKAVVGAFGGCGISSLHLDITTPRFTVSLFYL